MRPWPGREGGIQKMSETLDLGSFQIPSQSVSFCLILTSLFPSTRQTAFCTNQEPHQWLPAVMRMSPSCLQPVGNGFHICSSSSPCILEERLSLCPRLHHYWLHGRLTWGAFFFFLMLTTRTQISQSAIPERGLEIGTSEKLSK